jgi:hypothetical protein
MMTVAKLSIFLALTLGPIVFYHPAQQPQPASGCRLLEQALADYGQLKPGGSRAEVERYFSRDGGFQTSGSTRYVYAKCEYLHVDIEFEVAKPSDVTLSSTDKVTKISKLYAEYPAKD